MALQIYNARTHKRLVYLLLGLIEHFTPNDWVTLVVAAAAAGDVVFKSCSNAYRPHRLIPWISAEKYNLSRSPFLFDVFFFMRTAVPGPNKSNSCLGFLMVQPPVNPRQIKEEKNIHDRSLFWNGQSNGNNEKEKIGTEYKT